MKSFKDYLIESKQTYDFKIKIAGECAADCGKHIKHALSMYDATCSAGNRSPIQESHIDFPEHKNCEVTVFEVSLNYPATSEQIRACVAEHLKKTESSIKVRNPEEEAEAVLNHANDEPTGESLLEKPLEEVDGQSVVGDKHTMSLLKELGKNKRVLDQVKGTNDKILAKKAPSEKTAAAKVDKKAGTISPVGSKKVTKPDVKSARG
jgi:hypothetical protein